MGPNPCFLALSSAMPQGVRIALLRMASEIQACLPSMTAHPTRHGHNGKSIITRNSNLDEVQRGCLRVSAAAYLLKRHLFRHQGTISAALVLGGVDAVGTHLYQVGFKGRMGSVHRDLVSPTKGGGPHVSKRLWRHRGKECVLAGQVRGHEHSDERIRRLLSAYFHENDQRQT